MEYHNLVEDFARRTRANLRELKALRERGILVYEVTALVNSMLGLLVFPQQKYMDSIAEIPMEDLVRQGWPIPVVVGDFRQVSNLRQLIRYLRNAISHFNIEFYTEASDQIAGLIVWNVDPRTQKVTWKAKLSVEDLDNIAHRFIAMILRESSQ
jgi:hypothetical protein